MAGDDIKVASPAIFAVVSSDRFRLSCHRNLSGHSDVTNLLISIPTPSTNKFKASFSAHRNCFHHVCLRQHHLSANRLIHHIVRWHRRRFIIHVRHFLLHHLAEWLRAAFSARVLPARRSDRDSFQHDVLHLVADSLDWDNARTGLDLSDYLSSHAGNHLCYQRARWCALSRPGVAVHALAGCGEPCKK